MAGAYRTGSAGAIITTNTGANITAGVTAAVGELVWAVLTTRNAAATITTANGWTSYAVVITNGIAWNLFQVATSATNAWASPIVSSSSQQQCAIAGVLQGVDMPATDAANFGTSTGSTSPATVLQLTGGVTGGIVCDLFAMSRGSATTTWSASYTATVTGNTSTTTTGSTISAAYSLLASTGSTPSGTVTQGTAGNWGQSVAIAQQTSTTPATTLYHPRSMSLAPIIRAANY